MISKELFLTVMHSLIEREKTMNRIRGDLGCLGLNLDGDPLEGTVVGLLDAALGLDGVPDGGAVSWWWWDCYKSRMDGEPAIATIGSKDYRVSTPDELYDYAVDLKRYLDEP